MPIIDKINNAKTTDWLAEGLDAGQINKIKSLAIIASNIELRRLDLGMTQKDFATHMGVSQSMVSKWESGEYNFTISTLVEICNKLHLNLLPAIVDCGRDKSPQRCYTKAG